MSRRNYMVGNTYNDLKMYAILYLKLRHPSQKAKEATEKVSQAMEKIVHFWQKKRKRNVDSRKYLQVNFGSIRKKLRTLYSQLKAEFGHKFDWNELGTLSPHQRRRLAQYLDKQWSGVYHHHSQNCPRGEEDLLMCMQPRIIYANTTT